MMNVTTARTIADHIAQLASLVARFNSQFGEYERLDESAPQAAWEMYRQIMNQQATVANLLDHEALQSAHTRYGEWWLRADVMPTAIVNELAQEAFALIGRSAYNEDPATGNVAPEQTRALEQAIAGMLHPSTRQRGVIHNQV